jgi:hypothetical protein
MKTAAADASTEPASCGKASAVEPAVTSSPGPKAPKSVTLPETTRSTGITPDAGT